MSHTVGREGRRIRTGVVTALVVMTLVLGVAPAGAAGAGDAADGMLETTDVGLPVLSEPHATTLIAVDVVDPDTCKQKDPKGRDGRVVSFAEDPAAPTSGAQVIEAVSDYDSSAAAKASFKEVRADEQARAECGSTEKAENITFSKGPKKVGSARFTVTSDEQISGQTRKVTSVVLLQGTHVARVNFIEWTDDLPTVPKVAKRAADRLA